MCLPKITIYMLNINVYKMSDISYMAKKLYDNAVITNIEVKITYEKVIRN